MKKIIILSILILLINALTLKAFALTLVYDGAVHEYNNREITLYINGLEITGLPMPPVNLNDRVYVPARELFTAIGAIVDWKDNTREVYIGYGADLIILKIDSTSVFLNGIELQIPVAPKIINDKTMIPVRFPAELLGFYVDYDEQTNSVLIFEPNVPPLDIPDTQIPDIQIPVPTETPDVQIPVPTETPDVQLPVPIETPDVQDTPPDNSSHEENPNNAVSENAAPAPNELFLAHDVSPGDIPEEQHFEAQITGLVIPDDETQYIYKIEASSAISKVDKFLLEDNRLVIDIYNAGLELTELTYALGNNPYLSRIRAGQNQMTPVKITRFVFELSKPIGYAVVLSQDRTELTVTFEMNIINNVRFYTDETDDIIEIEGETAPVVTFFPLTNPDRLVIDIPLGILENTLDVLVLGNYATGIRASQLTEETARVTVDLTEHAGYSYTISDNKAVIKLSPPTYQNITFVSERMMLSIPKDDSFDLNINDIIHEDRYDIFKYILTLPGDYSAYLGVGEHLVKDNYINSIEIETVGGNTRIIFNEAQILAYAVTEDENNIYFNAMLPKDKYSRIIVLDPGHGGNAAGSVGNGLFEKTINLDVCLRLSALLEANPAIKVYMTRQTDVNPSFEYRVELGNTLGDLFISVHHNSVDSPYANGTEVYYHEHNINYTFTSKQVAAIIQKNLLQKLGLYDRKIKTSDFYVIKYSNIPAVLVEIGFISNAEEAAKIATEEFRQKAADSIYESILEIFSIYTPPR